MLNAEPGVTLIECMVAILISSLVLSSLTVLYIATQKNLERQEALMTIQENSRVALHILDSAIKTAGYIGCARLTNDFPFTSDMVLNEKNKIQSYMHGQIKPGSDAITIMRANPINDNLVINMVDHLHVTISADLSFDKRNHALIADCESAELFRVADVNSIGSNLQIIVSEKPLHKLYSYQAELSQFEINSYFVAKTERLDQNGNPIYALYMRDIDANKTELVEGVNDMHIEYSVVENGRLQDKNANQIQDWSQVVGIAMTLVFSGLNQAHVTQKEYLYVALRE